MKFRAWLAACSLALIAVSLPSVTHGQDYLPPNPGAYTYGTGAYAPNVATPYAAPSTTGAYSYGYGYSRPQGYTATGMGPAAGVGPFWAPGGYEARIGSPYLYHDPNGGQFVVTGNPYSDHFGPGFHRSQLHGHYRFPYYNYRAPWYYPGRAVYNRDTNLHW